MIRWGAWKSDHAFPIQLESLGATYRDPRIRGNLNADDRRAESWYPMRAPDNLLRDRLADIAVLAFAVEAELSGGWGLPT